MKTITAVTIKFPDIQLSTRDGHKLRGYFGNLFKENSPILHNHLASGDLRYKYPLVQYKVISKIPYLVGLEDGAELLIELFLRIKEIKIATNDSRNVKEFPVLSKNIESRQWDLGIAEDLQEYKFQTLWMALNQKNYLEYKNSSPEHQKEKLKRIGISNILAFYKSFDLILKPEERILMNLKVKEKSTRFKDNDMLAFAGTFTTNALIPDWIGLGKAVSRGFGTVYRNH